MNNKKSGSSILLFVGVLAFLLSIVRGVLYVSSYGIDTVSHRVRACQNYYAIEGLMIYGILLCKQYYNQKRNIPALLYHGPWFECVQKKWQGKIVCSEVKGSITVIATLFESGLAVDTFTCLLAKEKEGLVTLRWKK